MILLISALSSQNYRWEPLATSQNPLPNCYELSKGLTSDTEVFRKRDGWLQARLDLVLKQRTSTSWLSSPFSFCIFSSTILFCLHSSASFCDMVAKMASGMG
jgi:hypothetical protein